MINDDRYYSIPVKYRRLENLHIVFWLVKDISWLMIWKPLGLFMVIPTMIAALAITWQTRNYRSELFHNLAVVCWITANSYWMLVEFFAADDSIRMYAIIPFVIGFLIIAYFYVGLLLKRINKN